MKDPATLVMKPTPLTVRAHAIVTVMTGAHAGRVVELRPGTPVTLGRADNCAVRFEDASVSSQHATIVPIAGAWHLVDEGSTNGTTVNGERLAPGDARALADSDRIQLGPSTLLRFSVADDAEREALVRMYEAALRDPLTGAYNRKHLEERLDAELAFAQRHSTELSVVLFDIDWFKSINDTHGHLVGDAVLRGAVEALSKQLRAEDVLARYGGEEFVVIARGIPLRGAVALAERLRYALGAMIVRAPAVEVRVTASAGVASLACLGGARGRAGPGETKRALLALADERLYRAKDAGRNRVVGA